MKLRKSIRWRMLAWIAIFLSLTLSALGYTAYRIYFASQVSRLDQELRGRVAALSVALFAPSFAHPPAGPSSELLKNGTNLLPPPNRGSGQRPLAPPALASGPMPPGQRPPIDRALVSRAIKRFEVSNTNQLYFIIWTVEAGAPYEKSTPLPEIIPRPQVKDEDTGTYARTRGDYREVYHVTERGDCVLVGGSLAAEISRSRRFVTWLSMACVGTLVCGLGGMWLILGHALQPVKRISAAAQKIAAGNLSERINSKETENELGQLVAVLNSTFARLETAFAQQKQFTGDAAHELRTPIAVMISEAQTTLAREREAKDYRDALAANLEVAQQMRRLTDSLLELARLDAGQEALNREKTDLREIAQECVSLIRPLAAKRNLQIHSELAPVLVLADTARMAQVITNLLTNAVRYNRERGEIRVTTRSDDGSALLSVADTGQGIAAADLPRIFERFYRADKARSTTGSGLGLSISKAIVEAHGGSLEISSLENKGTTVTMRLPALES
jgi:heavy metal sensor kinase